MSEVTFHKIDPNGDVVLILRNPGAPFAVWDADLSFEGNSAKDYSTRPDTSSKWSWPACNKDAPTNSELQLPPAIPSTSGDWPTATDSGGKKKDKKKMMMMKKKMKKAQASATLDSVESAEAAEAYGEPVAEVYHEPVAEVYEETQPAVEAYGEPVPAAEVYEETQPAVEAYGEPAPAAEVYEEPAPAAEVYEETEPPAEAYEEQEPEVYHESGQDQPEEQVMKFLVSSRHLALASRYFFAKLSGPWMEASVKHIDGCYHMDASDWDSDALLILMQVIHGKTRSVPRRIDLEMLAKLAVLVDYYDCHEVIEIYCPVWIESLRDTLPADYGRDVVLWLLISYVFQQDDIFQQMTQVAVSKSDGPIRTMELPIPSIIVDLVDWRRQDTVEFIFEVLQQLLGAFRNETAGCSFECSSILLGALTKEMNKNKLLDPQPASPFSGYSIIETESTVRAFHSPEWCDYTHLSRWHSCNLLSMVNCYLNKDFEKGKQGFQLHEAGLHPEQVKKLRQEDKALLFSHLM